MGRRARCARARDRYTGAPALRLKLVAPAQAWAAIARAAVFPDTDVQPELGSITLTELQAQGAARARALIARYGGAVIADSVGMGKTFIALRLITKAIDDGAGAVIVVVPATLCHKWRQALHAAGQQTCAPNAVGAGAHVTVISHALVHRIALTESSRFVVVDEAHQFRNPRTARYQALARLAARARVLLLTATPMNNRPADLYWLLRLFLGDGAFADAGVPDLRAALRDDEHAELARRVIERIVIRRTRADVPASARTPAALRFPQQHPPRPVRYAPPGGTPPLAHVGEGLMSLRLGAFDVGRGLRAPASARHTNVATLIRIGLLKRLESSQHAFRASLVRLRRFLEAFDDALRCGGYLRPGDARTSDPLQLSLSGLLARPLPRGCDRARLAEDVRSDRHLIEGLLALADERCDTKPAALRALLESLEDQPRVVFTEFAETAEALFDVLPRAGVALLHGARAAVASGRVPRRSVLERFAPRACGATVPPAHERIHTLIATDVLAEGLDLQDARHCISYDLPWNPVRLMQRAGRVDRLGSPHDDVFVWYFEPAAELERLLGLMRRLGAKVRSIARMVGAEHGVVTEEAPFPHHAREAAAAATTPALRDSSRIRTGDERAHLPALRALVDAIGIDAPGARVHPHVEASYAVCPAVSRASLLAAWQVGGSRWTEGFAWNDHELVPIETAELIRLLTCLYPLPAQPPPDPARARAVIARALAAMRSTLAATARSSQPAERAADALRRALAATPGGPGPTLCRRADRILRRLRAGAAVAAMRDLGRIASDADRLPAATLCALLEEHLQTEIRHGGTARRRLRAVLLLDPPSG